MEHRKWRVWHCMNSHELRMHKYVAEAKTEGESAELQPEGWRYISGSKWEHEYG